MSRGRPAEVSGILVLNKHEGVTSHHMISICRRLFNTTQVGHTGTLDPMATGVLPILIGRAVKASEYVMAGEKRYIAGMRLGMTTDTEDITGTVLTTEDAIPDTAEVLAACKAFTGKIMQVPPMYSAVKIGGHKLVDLAREGKEVDREPREVEIAALVCTPTENPRDYILDVTCSKGTYIRTLCADIGAALGCGAVMSSLIRERSGGYTLDQAYTISMLEQMSYEERLTLPKPVETLFTDLPEVHLADFHAKLIRGGTELYQKKIRTHLETPGQLVRLYHKDTFFALGKVDMIEEQFVIRPEKLFVL